MRFGSGESRSDSLTRCPKNDASALSRHLPITLFYLADGHHTETPRAPGPRVSITEVVQQNCFCRAPGMAIQTQEWIEQR